MKPAFTIDYADRAASPLAAHALLSSSLAMRTYHVEQGFRASLGIYNASISRIFDKVISLAKKLEAYFKLSNSVEELRKFRQERIELIDYIELALYAAAEHVDDLDAIAVGFYPSRALAERSPQFRTLQKNIKSLKRFVAIAANSIKHQQARVRIYSLEPVQSLFEMSQTPKDEEEVSERHQPQPI
jgi:hypothetical protein